MLVAFPNLGALPAGATHHPYGHRSRYRPARSDGLIWDSAITASAFIDPLKGNNSDTVKALVLSLPISVAHAGPNAISLSWSAAAGPDCVLQSTTNLIPPVQWTPVTDPLPALVGGLYTVTLGTTNGTRFFRLHRPTHERLRLPRAGRCPMNTEFSLATI